MPAERTPRRRRGRGLLLAMLALAVVAAAVLVLVNRPDGRAGTAASTRPPAASSAPASSAAPPTSTPTTSTPSTTRAPSTPSATPSPKPSATASSPPANGTSSTGALRDAVTGYYALLPGDRDAAWNRLTPHYQRTTARSRSYFESFWSGIDSARVSSLDASAPDTVTATLTYSHADGRVYVERTRYRLAKSGGILKIDRSEVLSSVQH